MARLQVLHLPSSEDESKFALVLDELSQDDLAELNESITEELTVFRQNCGAVAMLGVPFRVEVL